MTPVSVLCIHLHQGWVFQVKAGTLAGLQLSPRALLRARELHGGGGTVLPLAVPENLTVPEADPGSEGALQ